LANTQKIVEKQL